MVAMDIGAIRLVLSHAAAVHGLPVSIEQVDLGRIALKRLGLVGKSNQRDRRPTDDELAKLIAHFDGNPRQLIPMGRIIKFAVATAMRQEEICRVAWSDLDERTKMLTIRDRKDPREKKGNDHLAAGGFRLRRLGADREAAGDPRQRGRPHLPLRPQVREQRLHPGLPGPAHRGLALPPAPRRHEPPVRRRLPHRAGLARQATRTGRCCAATPT
jgi:integrase